MSGAARSGRMPVPFDTSSGRMRCDIWPSSRRAPRRGMHQRCERLIDGLSCDEDPIDGSVVVR